MKTSSNFRKRSSLQRYMTIGPESSIDSNKNYAETLRTRIKTVLSMNENIKTINLQCLDTSEQQAVIVPKRVKTYDDEESMVQDFKLDWERSKTAKKQTYRKLRSQFVQKFPQYKTKYKEGELDEQIQIKINQTLEQEATRTVYSSNDIRESIRQTNSLRKRERDLHQSNAFYSRSKKKCMRNTYHQDDGLKQKKEKAPSIPRLSFLAYMKKKQTRKYLRGEKVKGFNLIKKKEDILSLQKQGSKQHDQLKKYLQDAIQACKTK